MGGWDYWTYQNQPTWFINEIKEMIQEEYYESKKQEMKSKGFRR